MTSSWCCVFSSIITIIITAGIHMNFFSLMRNFTFVLSFGHHNNFMIVVRASINIPVIWTKETRHKQHAVETQRRKG